MLRCRIKVTGRYPFRNEQYDRYRQMVDDFGQDAADERYGAEPKEWAIEITGTSDTAGRVSATLYTDNEDNGPWPQEWAEVSEWEDSFGNIVAIVTDY